MVNIHGRLDLYWLSDFSLCPYTTTYVSLSLYHYMCVCPHSTIYVILIPNLIPGDRHMSVVSKSCQKLVKHVNNERLNLPGEYPDKSRRDHRYDPL